MILSNPAPTIGGPLCCDGEHLAPGPRDQRPVEARDDVLVYTAPAFAQDTEITGPVSLELFAQSSAVDTDFLGKLVDVGAGRIRAESDGRNYPGAVSQLAGKT